MEYLLQVETNTFITFIGLIATLFSVLTYFPQIVKVYRIKKACQISILSIAFASISSVFWCIYAIMIDAQILLIAQIITLLTRATLIAMKIHYRKKK